MTNPDRLRLYFYSEKLLQGFAGQPPYKGCGIATDANCTALATLNESLLLPTGRYKSRAGRTADLKRGWRAFTKVADSNGIPDTDDLLRIHGAMFPKLPNPDKLFTRDFDEVVDRLDKDFAVSIAVRLSIFGATNSIDLTDADHQVCLYRRKGDKVRVIGPMRSHSDRYTGHPAPLNDVRKAAKAIEGGLVLSWLYPIEGWTAAALTARRVRQQNADVEARLRRRIAELERMDDCADEVMDARRDLLISLKGWIEERTP